MVKVDLGAAKAQVSSIKKVCNALNDQVDQIQDAVEEFIDNASLKGKGYQGAKEFGATVVINAWRAVRVAFEAVGKGADQMIKEYGSSVDTKSWSDKELEDKIKALQCDKAQLSAQIAALQDLTKMVSQNKGDTDNLNKTIQASNQAVGTLDDQINHFKQLKQHLDEFSTKSSRFMNDAQSLISEAMTGIGELNNGLNPQTGECVLPDNGQLTWINDVNAKADKYDSRKEQFIDMMSDAYGLDEKGAKDLYTLQNGIEKYAKKYHKDPMWAVYEFNRIIASLSGYEDGFVWGQAGCMPYPDIRKLCKKYGVKLNENKYKDYLCKDLLEQHNNNQKIDLGHESVIIASYTQKGKNDKTVKNGEISYLLTRCMGYGIQLDPYSDCKFNNEFNENVSYRGDILSGPDKAQMPDLSADVDAENIYNRAKKAKSASQALRTPVEYYKGIADGSINRKKEFNENHGGWEKVEQSINSMTPEDILLRNKSNCADPKRISLQKPVSDNEIKTAKNNLKEYLDTKPKGFEALFN